MPLVFRFVFVRIGNVQSERNNGNRTLAISRLYFYNLEHAVALDIAEVFEWKM